MARESERLRALLDEVPPVAAAKERALTRTESRLLSFLRMRGERAVRGRLVSSYRFAARPTPAGPMAITMQIEGRHAMMVAQQLAKIFAMVEDVDRADAQRTDRGAEVALRPRERGR